MSVRSDLTFAEQEVEITLCIVAYIDYVGGIDFDHFAQSQGIMDDYIDMALEHQLVVAIRDRLVVTDLGRATYKKRTKITSELLDTFSDTLAETHFLNDIFGKSLPFISDHRGHD